MTRERADGSANGSSPAVGSYTIRFGSAGDRVTCRGDETVLGAILRSGAKVVFGCRGGGCGVCKMRLTEGRIDHGRCSVAVLSEDDRTAGSFLSCQARPLTDLTVELTAANGYRRSFLAAWTTGTSGSLTR